MKYRVSHRTHYKYPQAVVTCYNEAHLLPRDCVGQTCLQTRLSVDPLPTDYRERQDFFGNTTTYFEIHRPHQELTITAVSEISMGGTPPQLEFGSPTTWEQVRDKLKLDQAPDDPEALQFTMDSRRVRASADLLQFAQPSFPPARPLIEGVKDLIGRIHGEFTFDPQFTEVTTPLSEVLKHRRGVCQDFAHLAIGALRSLGLAARYVSGYLETRPPPGQEKLVGADASHAWISVYLPNTGWLDFDPTNNLDSMERYITTAWGRDYSDVTPLKGVIYGGGKKHQLNVSVDVQALPD
ncbi:MAG: transglutaminase family protein [Gammaproteobacteria bacterium]|nr:transglutaminase family protein [Gammaproteobacteria bacterium]